MENNLGDKIKEKKWKVKVLSDEEANSVNGDVDIIVEDEDTLLFIQLKRTYLRLNSRDRYYESVLIDRKAAKQLNLAQEFLSHPNQVFSSKKNPIKWIVSTSFEGILQQIDGCRKVNYFELINALKNPEIKSLNELINDVESDTNLKRVKDSLSKPELEEEAKEMMRSMGLPIPVFESQAYRILLADKDEQETSTYFQCYNKALEFDRAGNKERAISLFYRCIQMNESDGDVWGAIANSLIDIRIAREAFVAFENALRLLPGDPTVMRNYGLALIERHEYFKGLKLLQELYLKYPLLGNARREFESNYQKCLSHGLLLIEEISYLESQPNQKETS